MFGRSKPPAFKPYSFGNTKPARRMPRWLIWLLVGAVLGVAGVIYVQEEYMPPRLTARQSEQLTSQLAQTGTALQQAQQDLARAQEALAAGQAERERLASELARAQAAVKPLQDDLALLQEVLPPDPRGGDLQIRAGRFYNEGAGLAYHLVVTRADESKPFKGNVQFAVSGSYPNGRNATVNLDPIALEVDGYSNVQGTVALPDGLRARQITTRIVDGGGRMQAMRVINTRN